MQSATQESESRIPPRLKRRSSFYPASLMNVKDTIGFRIRQRLYKIEATIGPFVKKIIPNFMAAHYAYIISCCIFGSIIIYPTKNIAYIDCLLFATGASTQAGLNSIDVNELTLHQQIMLYVLAMISNPIYIHSAVVFLRLWWFEKTFDGIKQRSKENFRMRRSATLAAFRTQTMEENFPRTNTMHTTNGVRLRSSKFKGPNTSNHQDGYGTHNASEDLTTRMKKFTNGADYYEDIEENKLDKVLEDQEYTVQGSSSSGTSPQQKANEKQYSDNPHHDIEMTELPSQQYSVIHSVDHSSEEFDPNTYNDVVHLSEPSDSEEETDHNQGHVYSTPDLTIPAKTEDKDIRFANLPKPPRRRDKEIEPRDLYMSISMMQHNKQQQNNNDESGPALVIRGPAEREERPLPGHKHRYRSHLKQRRHIKHYKKRLREKLAQQKLTQDSVSESEPEETPLPVATIVSTPPAEKLSTRRPAGSLSIQFEDPKKPVRRESTTPKLSKLSNIAALPKHSGPSSSEDEDSDLSAEFDSNGELSSDGGEGVASDNDAEESEVEGFRNVGRTQSQIVFTSAYPEKVVSPGFKLNQRAHTLDVPPGEVEKLNFDTRGLSKPKKIVKSMTFDKMVRNKMHRRASVKLTKIGRRLTKTRSGIGRLARTNTENLSDDGLASLYSAGKYMKTSPTYLSWIPTVGRNSTFVTLTDQQKEELGGVEYRSIKLLGWILIMYFVGFSVLATIMFVPFIVLRKHYAEVVRACGVSPTWWGFFTSMSCFTDLGFTLTPNSMISFRENGYIMIISSFFIVVGNTGFPIFLRFIIWCLHKASAPLTLRHESSRFLLDHPRRCFTLLFPSGPTWWLFFVLVLLNVIDWLLFIILDFHSEVLKDTRPGYRVLDGLFQAFSTRTAGFAITDLSSLNPGIQVSYLVMMYISVLPLAISIRQTNVYEEQSLGIYVDHQAENSDDSTAENSRVSFIGTHLRRQLSFDLWFLFLGLFIICINESARLKSGDTHFSIFSVLFEITSAYGTVGLSLGYPNFNTSFCGQFKTLSKLVIIAMMIRGRHRGLPYSIDRAIMLPTDKTNLRDDIQTQQELRRTHTLQNAYSQASGNGANQGPLIRVNTTMGNNIARRRRGSSFSEIIKGASSIASKLTKNIFAHDPTTLSTRSHFLNRQDTLNPNLSHALLAQQPTEEGRGEERIPGLVPAPSFGGINDSRARANYYHDDVFHDFSNDVGSQVGSVDQYYGTNPLSGPSEGSQQIKFEINSPVKKDSGRRQSF